jgi:hypothetical protein
VIEVSFSLGPNRVGTPSPEDGDKSSFRNAVVSPEGRSVSQYVLVSSTLVGLATRYYFLSECCCLKFEVQFLWGALSDERMGLQFAVQSLNGPSHAEPITILYSLIWDSHNLEGQVPVFTCISPRNRVAQLYPQALGSLYVVSEFNSGWCGIAHGESSYWSALITPYEAQENRHSCGG